RRRKRISIWRLQKKLKVCLEKAGFEVVMTREADESVKGPEQGNKKSTDMRNRCAKIREAKPAMAVSIHQNSYTEEYVSGPQVFYYTTSAEGKDIAGMYLQDVMKKEPTDRKTAGNQGE
ncbi:MAG: N-acetylmuramoyl-L-alanine amidase, partial [Lachnospiraceae bacterium]